MDQELELAKAIKNGTLDLICPEMELLVCPSYHEVALKGAGVIRSDQLGRLYCRMIAPFSSPRHDSLFGVKPIGKLYVPEDYVMLRAIDEKGREWRSNPIRVDLHNDLPVSNYEVHTQLSSILNSEQRGESKDSCVLVVIPRVPDLPFDALTQTSRLVDKRETGFSSCLDHHKHAIGNATVTFRRLEGGFLSVSAVQHGAFFSRWAGLMCQALSFAVAQTLSPAVIVREFNDRIDLSLYSGPFWRLVSMMHRPVPFTDLRGRYDFWRLVELFFLHVERDQVEPHPLLEEIEGIRRGSQGSLQTACLTLAVGIESIARLLLHDNFSALIPRPSIAPLLKYLDAWDGDDTLKKRAEGSLSQMVDIRASDLMYAWAEGTGVDKKLVDDWRKLRNPKAHGSSVALESGWGLYCSALELFNRIIAYAVGYDGQILQTSQPGWGIPQ